MTTTHETPSAAHGAPTDGTRPEPIDPEQDIDARSTSLWVLGSAVVLFISLYFMLPLFDRVLEQERMRKIDLLPAVELEEVLTAEREFLRGEYSTSKRSIDDVMKGMATDR
jgi:beta-lactamase regulating signal transducer with metallopeptidase domain